MQHSKQRRGKYALLILNFFTTTLQIIWCFFLSAIFFISIVGLLSGNAGQIFPLLVSFFSPVDSPRKLLLVTDIVFLVLSFSVWIIRWFARHRIASLAEDGKKYLLTWKKFRERRSAIIRGMWSILQVIWAGLILAVVIPLASNLLENDPQHAINSIIVQGIRPIFLDSHLEERLVLFAIVTFIFLSLILRLLAHSQSKEENIVSVKELEPVHKSLDAVSRELQMLSQDFVNRILEDTDEQVIKGLTEKIVEPLQQQLEAEKEARLRLEEQVQQLKQQTKGSSVLATQGMQLQTEATEKLNNS